MSGRDDDAKAPDAPKMPVFFDCGCSHHAAPCRIVVAPPPADVGKLCWRRAERVPTLEPFILRVPGALGHGLVVALGIAALALLARVGGPVGSRIALAVWCVAVAAYAFLVYRRWRAR